MHPYEGLNFFEFFIKLISRLYAFLQGKISLTDIATDEIQIIVLMGVAASAAILGTFLVLRKMTMLANALSHTVLLGIVLAYVSSHFAEISIETMLLCALITGLFTTYLTECLTKITKLQEDASIGLVFTSLFALGIILATVFTRNAHLGIETVMGNADALQLEDCQWVLIILGLNIVLTTLFFKEFVLTTFDPPLGTALGFSVIFFNYLLMSQTSATTLGGFRAVGVLMVLAFLTGPVLMARLLTHHLKTALLLAILLGCSASLIGVALSRHMLSVYDIPLSTSGLVVCVIAILFLLIRTVISIVNNSCCGDHRIRREKENQDTEKKEAY